tara:strand:- start:102 stop:572 length:471 start_codon:yes stop_codon:yes gene_type:complete
MVTDFVTQAAYVPLETLYLQGPWLYGYGFWQGTSAETICAHSSGADALFWVDNPEECSNIIHKKVMGFAIAVYVVIFCSCVYMWASAYYWRMVYINPIVQELSLFRKQYYEKTVGNLDAPLTRPVCDEPRALDKERGCVDLGKTTEKTPAIKAHLS